MQEINYREVLREMSQMSPSQLWDVYPDRQKFEDKIEVECDKIEENPQLVYEQFMNYLKVPVRKPWIVSWLCKQIAKNLNESDAKVLESVQPG